VRREGNEDENGDMKWKIFYIGAEIRFQLGENGKTFEAFAAVFINWSGIYLAKFLFSLKDEIARENARESLLVTFEFDMKVFWLFNGFIIFEISYCFFLTALFEGCATIVDWGPFRESVTSAHLHNCLTATWRH
jgi:hypothetical protein